MATIRAYKLGSMATDDITEVKSMGIFNSVTVARYQTLESADGTDYQVAGGATLYLTMINFGKGDTKYEIGYGDTAVANSASAPTNYVALARYYNNTAQDDMGNVPVAIAIPAGKYPCLRIYSGGTAPDHFMAYGIEL